MEQLLSWLMSTVDSSGCSIYLLKNKILDFCNQLFPFHLVFDWLIYRLCYQPAPSAPPGRLCRVCRSCLPSHWDGPLRELPATRRFFRVLFQTFKTQKKKDDSEPEMTLFSSYNIKQTLTWIWQFALLTKLAVEFVEHFADFEVGSDAGRLGSLENLQRGLNKNKLPPFAFNMII